TRRGGASSMDGLLRTVAAGKVRRAKNRSPPVRTQPTEANAPPAGVVGTRWRGAESAGAGQQPLAPGGIQ
ncbi:MAG: hypothetical protein OXJ56_16465, partial [Rhodospirillaceae bacterium]|nr:hypothetical protein [Rhodospirillaceae bacterium]